LLGTTHVGFFRADKAPGVSVSITAEAGESQPVQSAVWHHMAFITGNCLQFGLDPWKSFRRHFKANI